MCICLLADDVCYLFNKLSPRWKGAEVKRQMSLILHCPSEDTQGGLEGSGKCKPWNQITSDLFKTELRSHTSKVTDYTRL